MEGIQAPELPTWEHPHKILVASSLIYATRPEESLRLTACCILRGRTTFRSETGMGAYPKSAKNIGESHRHSTTTPACPPARRPSTPSRLWHGARLYPSSSTLAARLAPRTPESLLAVRLLVRYIRIQAPFLSVQVSVHVSDGEAQQNAQFVYRRSWARRHRVPNIHWRQMLSTL